MTYIPADNPIENSDGHRFIIRAHFTKVKGEKTQVTISLPKEIIKTLKLKENDIIEVMIRKVDEKYALEEYKYIPQRKLRGIWVTCPVCGKEGRISLRAKDLGLQVNHDNKEIHYVSKMLYPKFYIDTYNQLLNLDIISADIKERIKKQLDKLTKKVNAKETKPSSDLILVDV